MSVNQTQDLGVIRRMSRTGAMSRERVGSAYADITRDITVMMDSACAFVVVAAKHSRTPVRSTVLRR